MGYGNRWNIENKLESEDVNMENNIKDNIIGNNNRMVKNKDRGIENKGGIVKNKKGIFFSVDAFLALAIIVAVLVLFYPSFHRTYFREDIHYDLLNSLSSTKVAEINNAYVQSLIAQGLVKDTNKTLLEQIGEFYAENSTLAKEFASSILNDVIVEENIGIWFDDELVASKNSTSFEDSHEIDVAQQVISGIQKGSPTRGYVAKAWLDSISGKSTIMEVRGDLMCGRWKTYSWGDYCGTAETKITYSFDMPSNMTVEKAYWLVEPSWVGQPTDLFVNGQEIFNGEINYFEIFDITDYILPGKNYAVLNGETGGDDGASHIFIKYTTSQLDTFPESDKFPFNTVSGKSILYHEKSIFIPSRINNMEVVLNVSRDTSLSIRKGSTIINIGTKTPSRNQVNFSNSDITNALAAQGMSYENLSNEYFFVIAKVGIDRAGRDVALGDSSYIRINHEDYNVPFGSIDMKRNILLQEFSKKLQNSYYNYLVWNFSLPMSATPLMADWQIGWLSTSQQATQEARANSVVLFKSPPEIYIPALSRFGYTSMKQGTFVTGYNNFTLDFGDSYGASNESSHGTLTYFLKSFVNYGEAKEKAQGGTRRVVFQDDSSLDISVGNSNDAWDPEKDAIDDAVERLLLQFDSEQDGKIDLLLSEDSLVVDSLDVSDVPSLWSTRVQIRIWR